ncbi:MAG TPA: single-stranded DNA-binding protein [Marmoricola sp.]|nr:single-stranded DNA-binding protein [Marmoricola sp.]
MEQPDGSGPLNEVILRGRVSGEPLQRELPSGSVLVGFRLVLARERTPMTAASKQSSDWIECAAWGARVRKQAQSWHDGDQVEVRGSLRRRFFRTGDQGRSSVEVEMLGGRLLRRASGRGRESLRAATG